MKFIPFILLALMGGLVPATHAAPTVQLSDAEQSEKTAANAQIAALAQTRHVGVNVRVVDSLEGRSVVDVGRSLFESQHLGRDGVLILVAPTEHKVDFRWGKNLDAKISQAESKRVRAAMTARFKQGSINGGIRAGVDTLADILRPVAPVTRSATTPAAPQEPSYLWWVIGGVIGFLIVIGLALYARHASAEEDRRREEADERRRMRELTARETLRAHDTAYSPGAMAGVRGVDAARLRASLGERVVVRESAPAPQGHSTGAVVAAGVAGVGLGILADEMYHRHSHSEERRREPDSSPSSDTSGSWTDTTPSSSDTDSSSSSSGSWDSGSSDSGSSCDSSSSGGGSDW